MNIILFGFKRSGKTTLGKLLAKRLRRPFIDTDSVVEKICADEMQLELPLKQIVAQLGFDLFRKLEVRAVQSLTAVQESVISVGGGTVLSPDTVNLLEQLGRLVYIKVDKETLKNRLLSGELPLFFDPKHPEASFEKMYAERKPIYESISAIVVHTEGKSEAEVLARLEEVAHGK